MNWKKVTQTYKKALISNGYNENLLFHTQEPKSKNLIEKGISTGLIHHITNQLP